MVIAFEGCTALEQIKSRQLWLSGPPAVSSCSGSDGRISAGHSTEHKLISFTPACQSQFSRAEVCSEPAEVSDVLICDVVTSVRGVGQTDGTGAASVLLPCSAAVTLPEPEM